MYDSTVLEGTGIGVYIQAKAYELSDEKEIEKALSLLYGRKNETPRKPSEFLRDYPRRVYKAIPEKIWVNSESDIDGEYVDRRIEVNLI